jgi:hypothetical protein
VLYDVNSDQPIRSIHIAGTLTFARDRDTRLDVGLIKIQTGEDTTEEGFDCDVHAPDLDPGMPKPALEVGKPGQPMDAKHTALIRLVYFSGMDKQSCPAIVCCGGRMDFHGAPISRTWVKLGANARGEGSNVFRKPGAPPDRGQQGDKEITLAEPVKGWQVGDRIIITGTRTPIEGRKLAATDTEERTIQAIERTRVTLDQPLSCNHQGEGDYRGEVANLSRNVVVESADLEARGHTMYHRNSAGSISYAEFRQLGKEGVLGRYPVHFHLVGTSMRGSSVIGASIWDSGNRWLTIHGTNYLVVRDCVGYQSIGHGFYLEDGTEVYNVLDRNLAVQAFKGKPLPKQALPFDQNEGAGFWWANCLNTFTRNISCENERYGYRFQATPTSEVPLDLPIMQPDGTWRRVDIRTLPFVRFEDNESHCEGLYAFNLGEGVDRAGPDTRHPFVVRNMKLWATHYGFRPQVPSLLVENMRIWRATFGVYYPNFDNHVYRNLFIGKSEEDAFNRGLDDLSVQYGALAVDGLTFADVRSDDYLPLIQISDNNPTGLAVSHFRNVKLVNWTGNKKRALVNLGRGERPGGPRMTPTTAKGVPIYLHDYFGRGRHARVVSTKTRELREDGFAYQEVPLLTGDESRAAEVRDVAFPQLLDPVDDLPPTTVITYVTALGAGKVIVRGTTSDNGTVKRVVVNGQEARALAPNFAEWEIELSAAKPGKWKVSAHAEDAAGNVEKVPHVVVCR